MSYLFDTMLVSESMSPNPNAAVIAWLEEVPAIDRHVSAITLGEIDFGIRRLPAGKKRATLDLWLTKHVLPGFRDRVLSVTLDVARAWADMRADGMRRGRPLATADGLIAATAQVHGLTLATRNASDFAERGVKVVNPWA